MRERYYYTQWRNPTEDEAINFADGDKRRNPFPIKGLSRPTKIPSGKQIFSPSQFEVERKIHALRTQLTHKVINSAVYRMAVDPLRSSLRQILKGNS